jgi:alpha-1,2-mannosyltransferase
LSSRSALLGTRGAKGLVCAGAIALRMAKTGDWLTAQRIRTYASILLASEIAVFLFFVAGTHGLIVPLDRPNTTDFVSFYAAGSLTNAGTPELAYNAAAHFAAEQSVTEPGIAYNYFYYPPVFLLLCALLARLPYLVSFVAFETATLLLYLYSAQRILQTRGISSLIPLLAFPAVFLNVGLGQNAFLTAALFAGGMLLIERRPILAGLLLGAICYKPHFGLLIPIALASGGHWRAFASAVLSVSALVAISLVLFGWEAWHSYLLAALASPAVYESDRIHVVGFASPFGAVLSLGAKPPLAYLVQAAATLAAASWVGIVWARRLSLPIRAATLLAATMISIPVILFYDLMLGALAMAWLIQDGRANGFLPWQKTLLSFLFVLPILSANIGRSSFPMATPLYAALLFAIIVAAGWREIRATRLAAAHC